MTEHEQEAILAYSSQKAQWFGPTGIFPEHRERAATIERLCGTGPKTILELGAGAGGTAAAMADRGHSVTAVELSPVRVAYARQLAQGRSNIEIHEGDFYRIQLSNKHDVVVYWDGFGVGTDSDQRRLLRRVAQEWLRDDGCMLMDVFWPWAWANRAGREVRLRDIWRLVDGRVATVNLEVSLKQRFDFDPVTCRFSDSIWPVRRKAQAITQSVRCYSPLDLLLLLEGTGLIANRFEIAGEPFEVDGKLDGVGPKMTAESYLVRLVLASG